MHKKAAGKRRPSWDMPPPWAAIPLRVLRCLSVPVCSSPQK